MGTSHADLKLLNQPDESILEDIWMAFQNVDTIRLYDLQSISLTVEQGQVLLSGHIAKEFHYRNMEEIARSVNGVKAVHNHLTTDQSLILQVAQSLAEDKRIRLMILPVHCDHGWIALGGEVPSRELQQSAGAAAAQVPTVRGVILLPKVTGECEQAPRQAVQPPIVAKVYSEDGTEGSTTQVIIRPDNRLVTHAVVRVREKEDIWWVTHDYLVPVEAMDVVDAGGILLKGDAPALAAFPAFNSGDYPIAPLTWIPPYPYQFGSVRWSREEEASVVKGSQTQNYESLPKEKITMFE
jgi:hypothetical protein